MANAITDPTITDYYNNSISAIGISELYEKFGLEFTLEDGKITKIEGGTNNG